MKCAPVEAASGSVATLTRRGTLPTPPLSHARLLLGVEARTQSVMVQPIRRRKGRKGRRTPYERPLQAEIDVQRIDLDVTHRGRILQRHKRECRELKATIASMQVDVYETTGTVLRIWFLS